jgi:hypothetical protein
MRFTGIPRITTLPDYLSFFHPLPGCYCHTALLKVGDLQSCDFFYMLLSLKYIFPRCLRLAKKYVLKNRHFLQANPRGTDHLKENILLTIYNSSLRCNHGFRWGQPGAFHFQDNFPGLPDRLD